MASTKCDLSYTATHSSRKKRKIKRMQGKLNFIQQNGTDAHLSAHKNKEFVAALKSHNWNLQLVTHTARSPFSYVRDLSFDWFLEFNAKSTYYQTFLS